jgi:hypothetical protein
LEKIMTIKAQGLGSCGSAANGITISTTTNATPIVATFNAGHGLKDGDRVTITGITGNTGANGDWELKFTAATTAQLLGSVGNGVHGGTAVVAVLCDKTPFLPRYSVEGIVNPRGVGVVTAPVLTMLIEGSDDNSTFASALASGLEAIPAITTAGAFVREVKLQKYMRSRCSAFTSGSADTHLKA